MLAFYGRKGSTRAVLMQDMAVEACRAVSQLPTWMGYERSHNLDRSFCIFI